MEGAHSQISWDELYQVIYRVLQNFVPVVVVVVVDDVVAVVDK
jgi:hypothetical protein